MYNRERFGATPRLPSANRDNGDLEYESPWILLFGSGNRRGSLGRCFRNVQFQVPANLFPSGLHSDKKNQASFRKSPSSNRKCNKCIFKFGPFSSQPSFFSILTNRQPQVFACSQLLKVVEDLLSGRNKTTEIKEKLGWCWCAKNGRKCWIKGLWDHINGQKWKGKRVNFTPKRWRYHPTYNWWRGPLCRLFVANGLTNSSWQKAYGMECGVAPRFISCITVFIPETNSKFAPEKWMVRRWNCLFGKKGLFSGAFAVSFRVYGEHLWVSNLFAHIVHQPHIAWIESLVILIPRFVLPQNAKQNKTVV